MEYPSNHHDGGTSRPTRVWPYLTALRYDRTSASCVALAEALETGSHDRLTRLLQADSSGPRLLELACRTLFVWERGYLIIDDTVMAKPFATAIEGLAWGYSSQAHQPVSGLSLVLLVWTHGTVLLPLGMRLWHKGGPSPYALALALLRYARHRLRCRPESVLFEAWAPAPSLLNRMRDSRWVCCVAPAEEPPVQWPRGASASATPLLDRDWRVAWGPRKTHRQRRPEGPMPPLAWPCRQWRDGGSIGSARQSKRSSGSARINSPSPAVKPALSGRRDIIFSPAA